jgi:hypothetical protein
LIVRWDPTNWPNSTRSRAGPSRTIEITSESAPQTKTRGLRSLSAFCRLFRLVVASTRSGRSSASTKHSAVTGKGRPLASATASSMVPGAPEVPGAGLQRRGSTAGAAATGAPCSGAGPQALQAARAPRMIRGARLPMRAMIVVRPIAPVGARAETIRKNRVRSLRVSGLTLSATPGPSLDPSPFVQVRRYGASTTCS